MSDKIKDIAREVGYVGRRLREIDKSTKSYGVAWDKTNACDMADISQLLFDVEKRVGWYVGEWFGCEDIEIDTGKIADSYTKLVDSFESISFSRHWKENVSCYGQDPYVSLIIDGSILAAGLGIVDYANYKIAPEANNGIRLANDLLDRVSRIEGKEGRDPTHCIWLFLTHGVIPLRMCANFSSKAIANKLLDRGFVEADNIISAEIREYKDLADTAKCNSGSLSRQYKHHIISNVFLLGLISGDRMLRAPKIGETEPGWFVGAADAILQSPDASKDIVNRAIEFCIGNDFEVRKDGSIRYVAVDALCSLFLSVVKPFYASTKYYNEWFNYGLRDREKMRRVDGINFLPSKVYEVCCNDSRFLKYVNELANSDRQLKFSDRTGDVIRLDEGTCKRLMPRSPAPALAKPGF